MNASTGSSHTSASRIRLMTLSGSSIPIRPRTTPTSRVIMVQPYQYMAGPSPLRAAAHQKSTRFVAGWKVNSGRLNHSQATYMIGTEIPKTTTKALNLADAARDEVARAVLAVDVDCVAAVVIMIRIPGRY